MKAAVFLLFLVCASGATLEEYENTLQKCWSHLAAARADTYVACFTPETEFLLNGEADPVPWGDVEFLADFLTQVGYDKPKPGGAVSLVDGTDNTIMFLAESNAIVRATQEQAALGTQAFKITFNDELKITKYEVVADTKPLERLGEMLGPVEYDLKAVVQGFVTAWANGDVAGMTSKAFPNMRLVRNEEEDEVNWVEETFLKAVFADFTFAGMEIVLWAPMSHRSAICHIKGNLVKKGTTEQLPFYEAWTVVAGKTGKIHTLSSRGDQSHVLTLYRAMPDAMKAYGELRQKQHQQQQQQHQQRK